MAKRIKVSRKAHDTNINEFSMTFNHELGLYALKGESGGIENPYDIDRITYYFTEDQVKDYVNEFLLQILMHLTIILNLIQDILMMTILKA